MPHLRRASRTGRREQETLVCDEVLCLQVVRSLPMTCGSSNTMIFQRRHYLSFPRVVANHLQLPHAIRAWSLFLSSTEIENANPFDDAVGISASTGRPFSPPTSFRLVERPKPGKNEKTHIQQGKCHKCDKWVAVEGIKDLESKVMSAIFSLFVRPVDR